MINDIHSQLDGDKDIELDYKMLERTRGFLCHLAMVYDIIFPYLKGFHLTLANHLPKRNEEGWKLNDLEWIGHIESKVESGTLTREQADTSLQDSLTGNISPPKLVLPVPKFKQCLQVLHKMFSLPLPPVVVVRSTQVLCVVYGFVDASGSGFGSTIFVKGNVKYRIGAWSSLEADNSSNWREFENLVCEIEKCAKEGWLKDSMVLFATDNQVVESCLYKGNSSSPKLFDLIIRLRLVELEYGVKIIATHVSGTRMQSQGTDGVSRGSLKKGVALGKEMIEFCPWAKSPCEVSDKLETWVRKWSGMNTIFLSPSEWYTRGRDIVGGYYNKDKYWYPTIKKGTYVWSPPPAAADACLEELRKARMKRKDSLHIVLVQRLMTCTWLKQLNKCSDCIFSIPAAHPFWPSCNHEPLIVALIFPYIPFRPYHLKSTPKMFYMGRKLSGLFQKDCMDGGDILLKFLLEVRSFQSMPESVVWKMLYFRQPPPFPCTFTNSKGE